MNHRVLPTLLFAIIFALPAFGQQSGSNTSVPPADQTPSTASGEREKLQPPASSDFWDGDQPSFVSLVSHPLTTKKYVQRQVGPVRDRINELEELSASNKQSIRDVDTRAQQGLQLASEKTNLADQHASDAASKADTAKQSATQASNRVSNVEQMVANVDQYKASQQTEIRFRPGQSVLSKSAKDALDQMAAPLKDQRSYIIEVQGFAAGHGQSAIAASQTMADSVARYLVLNHQIPMHRIFVVGMGDAPAASADGSKPKRISGGRVEVNLLKNDVLTSLQR